MSVEDPPPNKAAEPPQPDEAKVLSVTEALLSREIRRIHDKQVAGTPLSSGEAGTLLRLRNQLAAEKARGAWTPPALPKTSTQPRKRRRKSSEPDRILQKALGILADQLRGIADKAPEARTPGDIRTAISVAETVRRLEADLNSPIDMRSLSRMSDHELEQLEKRLQGAK